MRPEVSSWRIASFAAPAQSGRANLPRVTLCATAVGFVKMGRAWLARRANQFRKSEACSHLSIRCTKNIPLPFFVKSMQ
jgi:hypothetical protein